MGRQLVGLLTNDAVRLCNLAFGIVADRQVTNRDLVLASQAITLAEKASPKNSPRVVATQALVLCESGGKKEECLARSREAFASAQEDSEEKAFAEACLQILEARLKPATTNQTSTNQIPTNRISTNPPPASRIQGPASKPRARD